MGFPNYTFIVIGVFRLGIYPFQEEKLVMILNCNKPGTVEFQTAVWVWGG